MIDHREIEKKWQAAWEAAKVYEMEPDERKPLLVTAAFPYVNTPLHIGHLRTYCTADLYARYMRMNGMNVLFPFALHASGTPVLAMSKRIRSKDKEIIENLKNFNVPDEEIARMEDPLYIIKFFSNRIEEGMKAAGVGVDWRRKFVSTDPIFSKMVEWQFGKLKELGYLEKGVHPVGWCTNDNGAVGQHDTLHDAHPTIDTITVINFKDQDSDATFPCATYRPETIYAVTNVFINQNHRYVIAEISGKRFYVSKDAAEALSLQLDVKVISEVQPSELLSKKAINPVTKEVVPVLPGFFVKPDFGTGVVMSVPSHAPFDYAALERLSASGYPMPKMEYRKIIGLDKKDAQAKSATAKPEDQEQAGIDVPSLAYLKVLDIDANADEDLLEEATKLIYREESRWGVMLVGEHKGMEESKARELIKKELQERGDAFSIYILSNPEPIYCRCGYRVVVKVVDQWFINYGNANWKESVRSYLPSILVYPKKLRAALESASEWIDLRATERAQGLGTKFPFDKSHIIESLSDSTIYPTLYTYIHILYSNGVKPEQLLPQFFDFVLLGLSDAESVSKATGIDTLVLKKCRESAQYWYQNTSRHSGADLIYNHYIMYIYNHVAIFPKDFWPKKIIVNAMVNYEGEKMSKSLGNTVPFNEAIERFGADHLRFIEVTGSELDTNTEFSQSALSSIISKNQFLLDAVLKLESMESAELAHIDYWLYSRLNSKIRAAKEALDELLLRVAYTEIYYNSISELKWYAERGGANLLAVREFLDKVALMLAPAMPHFAEELWHAMGNTTLVVKEQWPRFNEKDISQDAEEAEKIIKATIDDISKAVSITSNISSNKGKKEKLVKIIIADEWKTPAYNLLAEKKSISEVINAQGICDDKEKLSGFASQFSKRLMALEPIIPVSAAYLTNAFNQAKDWIAGKVDARVEVEAESQSKSARASRALPNRPSIDVVWS